MNVIAISNQKGGVGKSTTSNAISTGLIKKGFKVLCIDLDPQSNLSYSYGVMNRKISSLQVLTGEVRADRAIIHSKQGDIIPSSSSLGSADVVLSDTGKEYKLKEALAHLNRRYDYVITDTPPSLGILTINALTACNSVIIPTQADSYCMLGIGQLVQTITTVKKYCNGRIKIKGILITRYNARTIITKETTSMLEDTAKLLQTRLYNAKIRECTAIKEAQAKQVSIYEYNPVCNASKDYTALVDEILEQDRKEVKK